jgi:hypothetical protein
MKYLQHNPETFETLETDACNMQFRTIHLLAAWRMEARRYVEFAGGSGLVVLVGSDSAVAT